MPGPRLANKVSFNGTLGRHSAIYQLTNRCGDSNVVRFRSSPVPDRESLLSYGSDEGAPAYDLM